MTSERRALTRDQLYELVWAKPVDDLARELGLSGRGLGKVCARLVVPVPYRGYWARKAASQRVTRTHLPKARPEYPTEYTFDIPAEPRAESAPAESQAAIVVPDTLVEPHPLVAATAQALRAVNPSPKLLLACPDKPLLEMRVSAAQLDRAQRIVDTIIKTAIARGDTIEICDALGSYRHMGYIHSTPHEQFFGTWIRRDGDAIRLHLEQDEHQMRLPDPPLPPEPPQPKRRRHYEPPWRPPPPPRYEWRVVSDLRLRIEFQYLRESFQKNWNSSEQRPLERQLNRFFRELDKIFACLRPERLAREEEQRRAEEVARRAEEERQRVLAERRRAHDLRTRLRDWTASIRLHEFMAEVERDAVARLGSIAPESELAQWLAWARGYADALREDAVRTLPKLRELPAESSRPQAPMPATSETPPTYWETRQWWQRQ